MTFSDWTEETRRSLNDPFQLIVGRPLITSQQEENAIFYHSDHRTLNCKKPPKQILMKTSTQVLKTGQKKNHKMSENCHALKMRFTNSHSVWKSPKMSHFADHGIFFLAFWQSLIRFVKSFIVKWQQFNLMKIDQIVKLSPFCPSFL